MEDQRITQPANWTRLAFLCIAIIGLIGYANSFDVPFQFDGRTEILGNPSVFAFSSFSDLIDDTPLRMITYATFVLNYRLHGFDVFGFHAINLLLHVTNSLLLLMIVRSLLSLALGDSRSDPFVFLVALVAALVFVAHPLQTSAVTYIWQRSAVMVTTFFLSSFYCYLLYRRDNNKRMLLVSVATGVLAMLTKQNAIALAPLVLFTDLYLFKDAAADWKSRLTAIAPILLTTAIIPIVIFGLGDRSVEKAGMVSDVMHTHLSYILTQFKVRALYYKLILVPLGQSFHHDIVAIRSPIDMGFVLALLLEVSVLACAFVTRKRVPLVWFGVVFFFLTASIESGVFPLEDLSFEHRMYLPLVGALIALANIGLLLIKRYRLAFLALSACTVIGLTITTIQRNGVWRSQETFWTDVYEKNPNSYRAINELALAAMRSGENDQAETYLLKAINEPNQNAAVAYVNLGNLYFSRGNLNGAKEHYETATKKNPSYSHGWSSLAAYYYSQGETSQSADAARRATKHWPPIVEPYLTLARIAEDSGAFETALSTYQRAIGIGFPNATLYLRTALLALKSSLLDQDGIRKLAAKAATYAASSTDFLDAGFIYEQIGRPDLGEAVYLQASKEFPETLDIPWRLAQFYMNYEKPSLARPWAEESLRLCGGSCRDFAVIEGLVRELRQAFPSTTQK